MVPKTWPSHILKCFNIHGEKKWVNAVGPVINHVISAFWTSATKTEPKDQHSSL